jgi:hypothetical protein
VADQKEKSAILVAASIIAAVRLAREPIKNSPKVNATIEDSLQLARKTGLGLYRIDNQR